MPHTLRNLIRTLIKEEPTGKQAAKAVPGHGAVEAKRIEQDRHAAAILKTLGLYAERRLGAGANGIVYLASRDDGQRIAVKLTTQNEGEEYLKVKIVREKMPDNLKKHMPIVHFVEKLPARPGGFVEAIGIELLRPLPTVVSDRLLRPAGASPAAMQDVLRNEEILVKIFRTAAKKMGASAVAKDASRHIDVSRLLTNVESKMLQGKMPSDYQYDQIRKEVQVRGRDWADREYSLKGKKLAVMAGAWMGKLSSDAGVPGPTARLLGTNLALMVVQELQSTAMGIANPKDPDVSNWINRGHGIFSTLPGAEAIPGAESLGAALQTMAELGLSWRDLHKDNVMMRPSTGDIVVSDFGNFRVN